MQFRCFFCAVVLYGLLLSGPTSAQEPPGSVDKTFFSNGGADETVHAVTIQPDGKILIGGLFNTYYGSNRHRLARVLPNGSLDLTFDSPITDPVANVLAIAVQTNGQIIIGLDSAVPLMRLDASGNLDLTFNVGAIPDGAVHAILIQPDGKILIAGEFTHVGGQTRGRIARLNSDGSVDLSFTSAAGAGYIIEAIALQADGRILIGGQFTSYAGLPRNYLTRLTSNGSSDPTFTPGQGPNQKVYAISIQSDGKIVIGGFFYAYDGHLQNAVARLNTNGTYDASFTSLDLLQDGTVYAMELQPDGKIVIAGDMTTGHLVRLNTDGTEDDTYQPGSGPGDDVYAMAIQRDQKIVIGGLFTTVDVSPAFHIARVNADLKMLSPVKTGSDFSTQVQTTSGKSYRLEYKTALDESTWIPILNSQITGDGAVQPLHDSTATGPQRFYRVFGFSD